MSGTEDTAKNAFLWEWRKVTGEVGVMQDMQALKEFFRDDGEYFRLGHPPDDADVVALKRAIDDVVGNVVGNGGEAALTVIESAIDENGWFRPVLREHVTHEPSFRRALQLCERIVSGMHEARGGVCVKGVESVDALLEQLTFL